MSNGEDSGAGSTRGAGQLIEQVVQLAVIAGLVVLCIMIARPFLVPVLWGLIIAVALYPLWRKLESAFGGKSGLAATVFVILALAIVIVPTYFVVDSLLETALDLTRRLESGERPDIPAPSENVRDWPLVGDNLYDAWNLAYVDTEKALAKYEPQLKKGATAVLGLVSSAGSAVAQSLFAILIAAIFLGTATGGKRVALAIGERLGGEMGLRAVRDSAATIGSVAKGVLGVALVQGLLAGVALFMMGVPAAGLWTVGVMILAVIQLPPILLLAPICIWVFAADMAGTTWSAIFTIWCLGVSVADSFLKPIFLGRGVEIPMPVILIGAIGGMISMGIIGLFLGAIVLAMGYSLFMAWVGMGPPKTGPGDSQSSAPLPDAGSEAGA